MVPTSTKEQAAAALTTLHARLLNRSPQVELWERYFEGYHRLQFATSRFRQTFGNLFHEFADNWMELIVVASVERLNIQGFRFGQGKYDSDQDAWDIFRDNGLDAASDIAHTEAVKLGSAYLIVDDINRTELNNPLITVEHPVQVICAHSAGNRRNRTAALKAWLDDSGYIFANVYLPDGIWHFQTNQRAGIDNPDSNLGIYGNVFPTDFISVPAPFLGKRAEWIPRAGVPFFEPHKLGVVPVIPLENNPSLKVGGRSDIAPIIPVQDAVNKLVSDMIVASEFAAFRQRYATGIEIPKDPETGRPISDERFLAAVSRVWAVEDPDAKFGEFQVSDLGNYVKAIEMLIQHVAAITRTPPHYLLGQSGAFPSGDSLAATETGLVAKCKRKMTNFSPAWEEAIRLAFKAKGDLRWKEPAETVWADPEQRIRAARIDGAVKMSTLGVPQDAIWEELGASPSQIARWHAMRKEMGLGEYGTMFAPVEGPSASANPGPEGNLQQEQAVTQAVRVARVHD